MSEPRAEVDRILREHNATLARSKNHEVWKFPDGRIFTRALTPSDYRAENNNLSDLNKMLGLNVGKGLPGERRERRNRPGREGNHPRITPTINSALADKLRMIGVAEDSLKHKLQSARSELKSSMAANRRKRIELRRLQFELDNVLVMRLYRAWKRFRFMFGLYRKEN